MSPKVSVIVPVYNPGIYLKQSLDTILNQSLKDIEVICINDGSTDSSLLLLEEYAQKDSRIKIINKKQQGAGVARNTALEMATGEYLSFLDADDFFETYMLEYMYYAAEKDESEIVICGHYLYDNKQKQDVDIVYPLQKAIEKSPLTQESAYEFLFNISDSGVCNKLFKTEFVKKNKILFASCPIGEDLLFCWNALVLAEKISVSGIPFYHYRKSTSFQSTSFNYKPKEIILFLQMISLLYSKILLSPFASKWEKSFITELKKQIGWQLTCLTGFEKRRALKLIQKELPKDLIQKLFFDQNKPAVSLILCVYNGEKYLSECLESLFRQTLTNIEIICVNDGSTDNSLDILNGYALKDKRIKVLNHTENKSLPIARRTAMKEARGKYILCVDADDYLELDACECLYFYSQIFDLDMCSFMAMEFLDETREDFEDPYHRLQWLPQYFKTVLSVNDISDVVHRVAVSSCLTMYKHEFLQEKNIEWVNEPLFFEDNLFFTMSLFQAERFGQLKETFYHRRVHKGCVTQNRDKHFSDWCNIILRVLEIVQKYGSDKILSSYLEKYSLLGWNSYGQFSLEVQKKYEKDMLNFCKSLVQDYQCRLPENMQLWYDDLNTISLEDYAKFKEIEKKIDKNLVLSSYTNFYNCLSEEGLYQKYYQNFINHLKVDLKNKLFVCTLDEKVALLEDISKKIPEEVMREAFYSANKPAVSIIMPVFNAEKYLEQSLDSLIHQTLKNIEIICVDDGSTDESLKILNDYAQRDPRIKILTQKNSKQSIARRNAMKIARGEYIQYVDADDYIDLNACECLYMYSKIHNLDMLCFSGADFQNETNESINIPYHHLDWLPDNFIPVFSHKNIQNIVHKVAVTAWATFYRHDFLTENHIEWINEPVFYEDTPFFTECVLKAEHIGAIKKQFYHRRLHGDNTVLQMKNNFSDFCEMVQRALFIAKKYATDVAFNSLFYGYVEKVYNIYLELAPAAKIKFVTNMIQLFEYLRDNYELPLPDKIEKKLEIISNPYPVIGNYNVAILYIATGKYTCLWERFYKETEKYFLPDCKKTYFLFTDQKNLGLPENVIPVYISHEEWPYITLKRYHYFCSQKEVLKNFDYIYFMNANLVFQSHIGNEVLPTLEQGLAVTIHPWYLSAKREKFTYDRTPESKAFISQNEGEYYFMGGFNGGTSQSFLELSEMLKNWTDIDLQNNIIPLWHDESMLNRYMIDYMQQKMPLILLPTYAVPQEMNLKCEGIKGILLDKRNVIGMDYLKQIKKY